MMGTVIYFGSASQPMIHWNGAIGLLKMTNPSRPYHTEKRPELICLVYARGDGRMPIGHLVSSLDGKTMMFVQREQWDSPTISQVWSINLNPNEFKKNLEPRKMFGKGKPQEVKIFDDMLGELKTPVIGAEREWALGEKKTPAQTAQLRVA